MEAVKCRWIIHIDKEWLVSSQACVCINSPGDSGREY